LQFGYLALSGVITSNSAKKLIQKPSNFSQNPKNALQKPENTKLNCIIFDKQATIQLAFNIFSAVFN